MPVTDQVTLVGSAVRQFLDEHLPDRAQGVARWERQLAAAPRTPGPAVGHRAVMGIALETRIGLDLTDEPGAWWPLLSMLPPQQYRALFEHAGFAVPDLGMLPLEHTSDPLLCSWIRTQHPLSVHTAQEHETLALLLRLARAENVSHYLQREHIPVQQRRGLYQMLHAEHADMPIPESEEPELAALTGIWSGYLQHGRAALLSQGDRRVISPVLVPGFATADLVLGSTLVEIKLSASPQQFLPRWLDQLLTYLLCDQWDALGIQHLAVYSAEHACLMTLPVTAVLPAGRNGQGADLPGLRRRFQQHLLPTISTAAQHHLNP